MNGFTMEENLNSDLERTIFILKQFVEEDPDGLIEFDKKSLKNFLSSFSGQERRTIYSTMYNTGLIHVIKDKVYVDYNMLSSMEAFFDPETTDAYKNFFTEKEY